MNAPPARPRVPRRTLGAAALLAPLAAAPLAGCTREDGPVTVTVWHGFTEADGQIVGELAEEFNASQSTYRIAVEVSPWNVITDKILPAVSAGNGPDLVVQTPSDGERYARQGAFVPVQDFYDDPANETDTYLENVTAYTRIDGQQYGVPMGYGPFACWYSVAAFDEAGITEPPRTWEEWIALAEELTIPGAARPERYGLSLADRDTSQIVPTMLEANGGDAYADGAVVLDSPQNVETLEWWREAYRRGWGPTNITLPKSVDLFKNGKAAMTVLGPWMITVAESVGLEIGVFEVPAGPQRSVTQAAANYWWLTAQADDEVRAGAFAFLRHVNSHDAQVRWALGSYYPPNRTDITEDELAENPYVAAMTSYTKDATVRLDGLPRGGADAESVLTTLSVHITEDSGGDVAGLLSDAALQLEDAIDEDD
ncbi:ABC transporter substrate-binding protein [Brachybacterium sp. YJGR34]|uniref:ABC transporter substrate-binding protein n=1 Tax=Brachybacterium sp. YJGR34 TaxID=2059911 RepID=UPI0013003FCB|nr:ABC transporter substrate-binding protein [Brachybacterium sp. YJGR34]